MPTVGPQLPCRQRAVSRKIYILEPMNFKDMESTHLEGEARIIKQTDADANGFYQVELPVGTYSVFVEDAGRMYCNHFNSPGTACQVVVGKGPTRHDIKIDHAVW